MWVNVRKSARTSKEFTGIFQVSQKFLVVNIEVPRSQNLQSFFFKTWLDNAALKLAESLALFQKPPPKMGIEGITITFK